MCSPDRPQRPPPSAYVHGRLPTVLLKFGIMIGIYIVIVLDCVRYSSVCILVYTLVFTRSKPLQIIKNDATVKIGSVAIPKMQRREGVTVSRLGMRFYVSIASHTTHIHSFSQLVKHPLAFFQNSVPCASSRSILATDA